MNAINSPVEILTKLTTTQQLSYINLNADKKYAGWVTDFNMIDNQTGRRISLNLKDEKDLFLLFALASAWSRSGPWENAVFFTTYLKLRSDFSVDLCRNAQFIESEKANVDKSVNEIQKKVKFGGTLRKELYFRKDFFDSLKVLADNWELIKHALTVSHEKSNWQIFIDCISDIPGLAFGTRKMKMKIPLILRELRCQKVYDNIDGKYCCVADARVRGAYRELFHGTKVLPIDFWAASRQIYQDFGDLYDIPLFAYPDFKAAGCID